MQSTHPASPTRTPAVDSPVWSDRGSPHGSSAHRDGIDGEGVDTTGGRAGDAHPTPGAHQDVVRTGGTLEHHGPQTHRRDVGAQWMSSSSYDIVAVNDAPPPSEPVQPLYLQHLHLWAKLAKLLQVYTLMAASRQLVARRARRWTYDVFITHAQATGADQCAMLARLLEARGLKVWYDMQAEDLTLAGIEDGVRRSRNILVFMSDGIMSRPCCQQEQRWAQAYGCTFIGVKEDDARHGAVDLVKEKESAPQDLQHIVDNVEFIPYRRRVWERQAMVDELERRCRQAQ
jgi:hypothetical protein